jgi:maltose O-acetyltransferase
MMLHVIASEFRQYLANYWVAWIPSHTLRLFFYRRVMRMEIGPGSSILMGCHLDCAGGLVIGENCAVNQRCRLDSRGGIRIGNTVCISANVTILTSDHDPDSPGFVGRVAPVIIDDHCFIATGAIILKGVHIGAGAIVGAGSVVTRDIPPGEIWAGNPARKIRMRQAERFEYTTRYRRLFQ